MAGQAVSDVARKLAHALVDQLIAHHAPPLPRYNTAEHALWLSERERLEDELSMACSDAADEDEEDE